MAAMDWWAQVLTAGTGTVLAGRHDGERYVALPAGAPRVLVDAANPHALADAVRRYGSTRGSRLVSAASSPLARALSMVGPVWTAVPGGGASTPTLRALLSNLLGQPVQLSIAVGPERVNRKPVIRCYADDRIIAYAKLGPDPHTAALVRNEARWLNSLSSDPLADAVAPPIRHSGSYGRHPLLVTDPLEIAGVGPTSIDAMPVHVLESLRARGHQGVGLGDSPWWSRLWSDLAAVAGEALSTVAAAPEFDAVAWSTWHGDWSPWNVAKDRRGRTCVWDWERTEVGAPDHLDLVHLHYQYGAGLEAARDALRDSGLAPGHDDVLIAAYLLEMTSRHQAAGRLDTDAALVDQAALTASVARLGARRTS